MTAPEAPWQISLYMTVIVWGPGILVSLPGLLLIWWMRPAAHAPLGVVIMKTIFGMIVLAVFAVVIYALTVIQALGLIDDPTFSRYIECDPCL